MIDYEKLGSFYLGKTYDLEAGKRGDELVLYDANDLTTHAVIIGMTGSGKTGLGLCLLEEALIDNIPVIAIDPKGDLGNLMLTFPELRPEDFKPWVQAQDAATQGLTIDQFATKQAELWRKGLADWQQGPERIAKLRQNVSFQIYTPGSNSGRPLSVLRTLSPPPPETQDDNDLWRDAVQSTTTGLLTLLGIDADPLSSRDHILVANILENAWRKGQSLDIPALISSIQKPAFERLGVLDLESFYPAKERFALAMRLNNLLASPGFAAWLDGDPLDVASMFYGEGGRPRASIVNIAHLSDGERMFFVTLLLNRVISWMRTQPGTSSLRAILYLDEIFGYFPPVANPPSKAPLMLLLKQARAFGLGVVLATQNPVDIDYKGLANAGTWFLGRLQTERDKERVLDGLEGVSSAGGFDRQQMARTLSAMAKRVFLLHNVHDSTPAIFETRWALSYLAGPMSREQIRRLATTGDATQQPSAPAQPQAVALPPIGASSASASEGGYASAPPVMPPQVNAWYLRSSGTARDVVYQPAVLGVADIHYLSAKQGVDLSKRVALSAEADDMGQVEWGEAEEVNVEGGALMTQPEAGARFADLPSSAGNAKNYDRWQKSLLTSLRQDRPLTLFESKTFKLVSKPGESEAQFRARVALAAREQRDLQAAKLKKQYEPKFRALDERIRAARAAEARELSQARGKKLDATISFGTAVIGSLFGRRALSVSTASRVGSAISKATRASNESDDADRARDKVEALQLQLTELNDALEAEAGQLQGAFDSESEPIDEVAVRPKASDVELRLFGIIWRPFRRDAAGGMTKDW